MDALKEYVLSVTCAAILCGILLPLIKSGGIGTLLRLLCGVFLTLTLLSPIRSISLPDFEGLLSETRASGSEAAMEGEAYAKEGTAAIIKAQTEAYILDKAIQLDAQIQADITLESLESPIPVSADIWGNVTPYQRQALSQYLEQDLGITKENQRWYGER